MDKKSIFAIVLITVVILLLPEYYKLINDEPQTGYVAPVPSGEVVEKNTIVPEKEVQVSSEIKTPVQEKKVSPVLAKAVDQAKSIINISVTTPLINSKISNLGGGNIYEWDLQQYKTWLGNKVKIIDENLKNGFKINFITMNGVSVDLNNYAFHPAMEYPQTIILAPGESKKFDFSLILGTSKITKSVTYYADYYHVDIELVIENSSGLLLNNEYQAGWINGLPSNEENRSEDYSYSEAYASMGDEIENFTIDSEEESEKTTLNGKTDWLACQNQIFPCCCDSGKCQHKWCKFWWFRRKDR